MKCSVNRKREKNTCFVALRFATHVHTYRERSIHRCIYGSDLSAYVWVDMDTVVKKKKMVCNLFQSWYLGRAWKNDAALPFRCFFLFYALWYPWNSPATYDMRRVDTVFFLLLLFFYFVICPRYFFLISRFPTSTCKSKKRRSLMAFRPWPLLSTSQPWNK